MKAPAQDMPRSTRRRATVSGLARAALAGAVIVSLGGCGFQLRGPVQLPFKTLYVQVPDSSPFGAELKRTIRASGSTKVVDRADQGEAILVIANEIRDKQILSLGGGGRVREFALRYRIVFRVHDGKAKEYIPLNELTLKRDFSFNDSQVLAKDAEEALLYKDMQSDAVQQLVRRLQAARTDS